MSTSAQRTAELNGIDVMLPDEKLRAQIEALPKPARAKLKKLEARDKATLAVVMDAKEERENQRDIRDSYETEINRLDHAIRYGARASEADMARRTFCIAEREKAQARVLELDKQANATPPLWANAVYSGLKQNFGRKLRTVEPTESLPASNKLLFGIERVKEDIIGCDVQTKKLRNGSVDINTICGRITRAVERKKTPVSLASVARIDGPGILDLEGQLSGYLWDLFGSEITERLHARARALYTEGMTKQQRDAKLVEIAAEKDALERRLEQLVSAAEENNLPVKRDSFHWLAHLGLDFAD